MHISTPNIAIGLTIATGTLLGAAAGLGAEAPKHDGITRRDIGATIKTGVAFAAMGGAAGASLGWMYADSGSWGARSALALSGAAVGATLAAAALD